MVCRPFTISLASIWHSRLPSCSVLLPCSHLVSLRMPAAAPQTIVQCRTNKHLQESACYYCVFCTAFAHGRIKPPRKNSQLYTPLSNRLCAFRRGSSRPSLCICKWHTHLCKETYLYTRRLGQHVGLGEQQELLRGICQGRVICPSSQDK
jgi:hypothetical protein